ncbi:MAG: glycosyltransferase [Acidobacteria bacterium]|nr:glycosyltransferase [Acidobacteriota bacterium]
MPRPPAVSVVVVNWNRLDLLEACLASLRQQTWQDFETVVVDNGSTDGSADWVARERPDVVLIRNTENRGFCGANNQGIQAARGTFVALLNNDAEAEPRWLEALLAAAGQAPDIGMVASKIVSYDDPNVIDKVGHLIYPDGQNRGRGSGAIDRGQFDRIEEVAWPDGAGALYRKEMLDEIGLFDEDFFAYADDAELGLRGRLAGWRCLYTPHAVVRHRLGSTLGRHSQRRLFLIERNRIWLVAKLFPKRLWPAAPLFAALRVSASALAALRGRGEAGKARAQLSTWGLIQCLIRANAAALWGLPGMLAKRKRVVRRLSGAEAARLLRTFRISLAELIFETS